ncbi:hypothetical protein B0H10DRAFT_772137 [Mycena sp. CBHHK59/15]|nr:hypothetical protein B0H10DRAFT_772137 [Mycena sp. CBHHK59/15]
MLDGEVAQALGLGSFLVRYIQPAISNIHTTDKIELLAYLLKTCTVHFQRHIDELSKSNVLPDVIIRLKSILGLDSQEEIDAWHAFCAGQTHPKVQQWYLQKQRNPWYLPSVNAHLSKVSRDDWNITPRTTNIAETSHASTNADTSTSLPLLPLFLRDKSGTKTISTKYTKLRAMVSCGSAGTDPLSASALPSNERDGVRARGMNATTILQRMMPWPRIRRRGRRNGAFPSHVVIRSKSRFSWCRRS